MDKIISYVYNALSFIFNKEIFAVSKAVYLFGSAVRGELTEKSDIDIFVECEEKDEDLVKKSVEANIAKFYKSKDFEKWKYLGIKNPISVTAGDLKKWALKTSIYSEGIVIFKKSFVKKEEFERMVLVIFELPKQKPKYLKFIRAIFGRPEHMHKGYLQEIKGKKISSNAIIVPQESLHNVEKFLQKFNIKYQIMQFFMQKL